MKLSKLVFALVLLQFSNIASYGQISKLVTVVRPGTLSSFINWDERYTIKNLTVSGTIDARDISFISSNFSAIESVDLGAANIFGYYGSEGTIQSATAFYPENEMPQNSFSYIWETNAIGNKKIKSIILPATVKSIGSNAFNDCSNLTYLKLPVNLDTIKVAAFKNCTSLISIECLSIKPAVCLKDVFIGVNKATCQLKVSNNSTSKFQSNSSWQNFNIKSSGYVLSALSTNEQAGSVFGLSYRFYNNNEKVKLIARRKSTFSTLGWFENNGLISSDSIFEFYVSADRKLDVKFARSEKIHVLKKGTLSKLTNKPASITQLTISGNIDATDIRFIRDSMKALEEIDLRKSSISVYSGDNGPCYYVSNYIENELPAMSFFTYEISQGNMYLKTVRLPDNLVSIGENAFKNCSKIDSLLFPIHLKTTANSILTNCFSLKTLSVLSPTPIAFNSNAFFGFTPANCELIVPENTIQKYSSTTYWSDFKIKQGGYSISIKSSNKQNGTVSGVESRFYALNEQLTLRAKAINGTSLKGWYEKNQFIHTDSILELNVNDNREFTAVFELPATISQSEAGTLKNLLSNHENITHLTLSGKLDARDFQFMRDSMPALESLDISNTIIMAYSGNLGGYSGSTYAEHQLPGFAFSVSNYPSPGKTFLRNVILPQGLRSIGERAFYNCKALENVQLPESLIGISTNSFVNCTSLTSITLPPRLNAIDYTAFENCINLKTIYNFNTNPITINPYVFKGINISNCNLVVPTNFLNKYASADVWKNFKVSEGGYVITAASSQQTTGKVTSIENRFYALNEEITLKAKPINGTDFKNWTDNEQIVSNDTVYTFVVDGNHALIANFELEAAIVLETAGTLKDKIIDLNTTKLSISGNIDVRDIKFMRDQMIALEELDLSSSRIIAYSGTEGTGWGSAYYAPNELPENAFCNNNTFVGKQSLKSVILPDNLTTINTRAFRGCSYLQSVQIPFGVIYMYYQSFMDCSSLTSIKLPPNLSLFQSAFQGCTKLTSVILPVGLKAIDTDAFKGCINLGQIDFPQSVTTIGQNAFEGCISLKKIKFPAELASIEYNAFKNCTGIDSLMLPSKITTLKSSVFEGCSGLVSIAFPSELTAIDGSVFKSCTGLTALTFPVKLNSIGDNAFQFCSGIKTIDFPENITSLGYYAFDNCTGLISLKIPGKITTLGTVFSNCTSLKTIQLSTGLKRIVGYTFSNCTSLASISIPSGVTDINSSAFSKCTSLAEVNLPAGLNNIGSFTFSGCSSLKSIEIPAGTAFVDAFTFEDCSLLSSVTLPRELTSIGTAIFENCTLLTKITNLNPVPLASSSMVYGFRYMDQSKCKLIVHSSSVDAFKAAPEWKNFIVEGGGYSVLASTNNNMIGRVTGANRFYLPNETVTLEAITQLESTFVNWTENGAVISSNPMLSFQISSNRNLVAHFIRKITVNNPVAGSLNDSIIDANSVTALTVTGNIDARDVRFMRDNMLLLDSINLSHANIVAYSGYEGTVDYNNVYAENSLPLKSFENKLILKSITLPNNLISISDFAFANCAGLKSCDISNGLELIGSNAFRDCTTMGSINLPDGIQTIGSSAFVNCTGLKSITFPASLKTISQSAFSSCTGITSLALPQGLTTLEYSAFSQCSGLTRVSLPQNVSIVNDFAFSSCSNLETIEFSEGLTRISYSAFSACSKLKALNFPASLTFIGTAAFYGCLNLTEISFPAGLSVIAANSFASCTKLAKITNSNATPIEISADVFSDINQSSCSLLVPKGTESKYMSAAVWRKFKISGSGYSISALSNNFAIGQVSGLENRFYMLNESITLSATAKNDATFINWTENDTEITNNPNYTFAVTENRKLIANFKKEVSLDLSNAGTLANKVSNVSTISSFKLSGNIDARDIKFIRDNFQSLRDFDLKDAQIQSYSGNSGTLPFETYYPENEMPEGSFYDLYYGKKSTLVSVILPDELDSIGKFAFMECTTLKSIVLPEKLKSIEFQAFYNCSELDTITLPANLTTIQPGSFSKCTSLKKITNLNVNPVTINKDVFTSSIYSHCKLVVPDESLTLYKTTNFWNRFYMIVSESLDRKVLPDEVSVILYPIPSSNYVYLKTNDETVIKSVVVSDFSGKIHFSSNDSGSRIDISALPIGIYYIRVETSKGISLNKIIKK